MRSRLIANFVVKNRVPWLLARPSVPLWALGAWLDAASSVAHGMRMWQTNTRGCDEWASESEVRTTHALVHTIRVALVNI